MAIELKNLIDDRPKPPNFIIKKVTEEESTRIFGNVWANGYPMPTPLADYYMDCFNDLGIETDELKLYIGYLNGKPVSTSLLFLGGGVAGLYAVTVLQEARGHGIGTEMSLHPMREARRLGYYIGVLDATQQGYGIYKRIGFQDCGAPRIFIHSAPEQKDYDDKVKDFIHTPTN
jgi:GNAT superfamily N-acetyltransferase